MVSAVTEALSSEGSDRYEAFKLAYWSDPAGFVADCIRWRDDEDPVDYQLDVLRELADGIRHPDSGTIGGTNRVAVRGPRGLGKTTIAAWIVLWYALTRDGRDWKIATTAGSWGQLRDYLWPEVHKWALRLDWSRIGRDPLVEDRELLYLHIKLETGRAFAVASNKPGLMEGAHADHLLYVFDEAKTIPSETWDAVEGAFTGAGDDSPQEALALAISTPGEPAGRFYDIHRRAPGYEDWTPRHITLAQSIAAGRISDRWAQQRRRQWGDESQLYQNHVLGDFATAAEVSVIPLSWVEAAMDRWRELDREDLLTAESLGPMSAIGVDLADGGSDASIVAPRHGVVVPELVDITVPEKHRIMQTTGRISIFLKAATRRAVVDVIGIGSGVVSRLLELVEEGELPAETEVEPFNASETTKATDASGALGFLNKRAAAWWGMRERLDPESGDDVALPPDDELLQELTAPRWSTTSAGKIKVESKDDIKARIKRSTDRADAVVQAFWVDPPDATSAKKAGTPVPRGVSLLGGFSRGGSL